MKKIVLYIIFSILTVFSINSQIILDYNKIIDTEYYKSFYNERIDATSFVIYKLYKGGGNVSRSGMQFKEYENLNHFEYTNSGYDRGHLVPAEDFASDSLKLRSTFYYINAVPQHPKLNRGVWKTYENKIRHISQNDSLIIITGGCNYEDNIPMKMFKIVYSLTDGKCHYSLIFDNSYNAKAYSHPRVKELFTYKKVKKLYNKR